MAVKLSRRDLRSRTGWHETLMLEPCFVLPEQTATTEHARGAPERRLWMAVLQDAAEVFLGKKIAVQNVRRETAMWIMMPADGPCGFDWACHAVGIDPADMRRRLFTEHGKRYRGITWANLP